MRRTTSAFAKIAVAALTLSGCAGGAALDTASPQATPGPAPKPSDDITGRWVLSAPNAPFCGLNFAAPGSMSKEGRVSPEGGCPARFFLARRYRIDGDRLTVLDEANEMLGQLTATADGFSGTAASGDRITLNR
jgi:hypothetical protein